MLLSIQVDELGTVRLSTHTNTKHRLLVLFGSFLPDLNTMTGRISKLENAITQVVVFLNLLIVN